MKSIFTLLILFFVLKLSAQQNISDARRNLGMEVTVSGIVTNGSEFGIIRYFQDETAGLAAYGDNVEGIKRGDSVTITGTLKDYRNLLEIDPVVSVTVHSSNYELPAPKILSVEEIGEDYEGQLVQINDAEFVDAGGTFSGNTNYDFLAGGQTAELRINSNSPLVGEVIPAGKFNLVAICSQFSYNENDTRNGYQLLPRDLNDFISAEPLNFTSPVQVIEITQTSFSLAWSTDVFASSEVRFGSSPDKSTWQYLKNQSATDSDEDFLHEITISGFEPASIVHAEAFSVLESDTAFSTAGVYATKSNSSGNFNIYFNTPVSEDTWNLLTINTDEFNKSGQANKNMAEDPLYIGRAMEDTVIAYINRAKESIDFCIYNINNSGLSNVSEALNDALSRGVQVRFITDGSTNHNGTDDLLPEIPVLERPEIQNGGIMHNKFAIFDANSEDPNLPWVWTGSLNLTYDQVNTDAQNIIFIQDQSLAKAYEIEFEEMWGSAGAQPNASNAKFGDEKSDNTPHHFVIGDIWMESYFSPSDNTNQKIIDAINTANNDLHVETMLITRSDLALAIKNASDRGTNVHVVTNYVNDNSEAVNNILSQLPEGKFIFDDAANGILHHKTAIIDARLSISDPQVITGSHNWSNSANDRNDENTLIIHDWEIANKYLQQFAYRFTENGGNLFLTARDVELSKTKVFPNPVSENLMIRSEESIENIQLYDLSGIKIKEVNSLSEFEFTMDMTNYHPGIYILKVTIESNRKQVFKIVIQ